LGSLDIRQCAKGGAHADWLGLPAERAMKHKIRVRDARAPGPEEALDFILFEHLKHREMCNALDQLADAPSFDRAEVTRLAEFIRVDLTMHVFDEEEDFFPLLRQRCAPEDQVDAALDRFDREHEADRDLSAQVRIILYNAVSTSTPPSQMPGASEMLRAFAQGQRRHMMLENGVLIPLARRRLSKDDLEALGRRLADRRRPRTPAAIVLVHEHFE
jgi:hemerythrin-like domain-containing protein